jgi:ribosomal protein S18 acetylase RimI-like enzyme
VLYDYFEFERDENGHLAATIVVDGVPAGFVYYAPDTMTFGTWEMWWIAVDPRRHGSGLGRRLVEFCENDVLAAGGRMLFIDTSSLPEYEPTRRFYLALGYEQDAVLRDYFNDGDSKVVFRKRLAAAKL